MVVAILYICTGKYASFFKDFHASCNSLFLPEAKKTFFVWTDDDTLGQGLDDIRVFHRDCKGFPADSLFRFGMFLQAEEELKHFDYIYFFNSNALILKPIGEDILPDETELVAGRWPGKRERQHPMFYPYERNKYSTAYIPPRKPPYIYFMGGLNGGTASAYLEMVHTLSDNIRKDEQNGIIAYVHDESHINRYLRDHPCKILGAEYSTPEEHTYRKLKYEPKIIFRDKVRLDPFFNKGRKRSLTGRIRKGWRILFRAIDWYL